MGDSIRESDEGVEESQYAEMKRGLDLTPNVTKTAESLQSAELKRKQLSKLSHNPGGEDLAISSSRFKTRPMSSK